MMLRIIFVTLVYLFMMLWNIPCCMYYRVCLGIYHFVGMCLLVQLKLGYHEQFLLIRIAEFLNVKLQVFAGAAVDLFRRISRGETTLRDLMLVVPYVALTLSLASLLAGLKMYFRFRKRIFLQVLNAYVLLGYQYPLTWRIFTAHNAVGNWNLNVCLGMYHFVGMCLLLQLELGYYEQFLLIRIAEFLNENLQRFAGAAVDLFRRISRGDTTLRDLMLVVPFAALTWSLASLLAGLKMYFRFRKRVFLQVLNAYVLLGYEYPLTQRIFTTHNSIGNWNLYVLESD